MNCYFTKTLNLSFDKAIAQLTEEPKKEGFGVLTDIVRPEASHQGATAETEEWMK